MSKKIRKVDVMSTQLKFVNKNKTTFEEILTFLNNKEFDNGHKNFEFNIIDNKPQQDYLIGIVITTQLKEIPPLRDFKQKTYKAIKFNMTQESLAFANVFLFDKKRNIFIYEINKNGCYPNELRDTIYNLWNRDEDNEDIRFDITFPVILRKNEYDRVLELDYYKRIQIEIYNPLKLVDEFKDSKNTMLQSINDLSNSSATSNADSIIYELEVKSKKVNKLGLSRSFTKDGINAFKEIVDKGFLNNVGEFVVEGFDNDSESPNKLRKIDLFGDAFKESFKIENIKIHTDDQKTERQLGIKQVYDKILPELKNITGIN